MTELRNRCVESCAGGDATAPDAAKRLAARADRLKKIRAVTRRSLLLGSLAWGGAPNHTTKSTAPVNLDASASNLDAGRRPRLRVKKKIACVTEWQVTRSPAPQTRRQMVKKAGDIDYLPHNCSLRYALAAFCAHRRRTSLPSCMNSASEDGFRKYSVAPRSSARRRSSGESDELIITTGILP